MSDSDDNELGAVPQLDPEAASGTVPLAARMAHQIPQPKDWEAFQRGCVLLFRGELDDPHVQEYGRQGQTQSGIDLIGRRDRKPDHWVGIQCRKIEKPLKEDKILADCRAAVTLPQGLRELVFATTAPNDRNTTDAAARVEKLLRSEGHDLTVIVYGWGELQNRIAEHLDAYRFFMPSSVSSSAPIATRPPLSPNEIDLLASRLQERMEARPALIPVGTTDKSSRVAEDPPLHGKIDVYRDILGKENQPIIARKGLLDLLERNDLSNKPWARFRIETNLASAAVDLGREAEAAERLEASYETYPNEALSIANLSFARLIQGRFAESMALAKQALAMEPRANHAVGYLLQAAGRSDWEGDPQSLIPTDLVGSREADIGLAEFYRRRERADWAERVIEVCKRHPHVKEFRRFRGLAVLALAVESENLLAGGTGPVSQAQLNEAADDLKAIAEHYLDVGFADKRDLAAFLNNAGVLLRLAGRYGECAALMERGLLHVAGEATISRLLALARLAEGRRKDAISALVGTSDPESLLIAAELRAETDLKEATDQAFSVTVPTGDVRLARVKWTLAGELAVRLNDRSRVHEAIAALRAHSHGALAHALEARGGELLGHDEAEIQRRLRAASSALGSDAALMDRVALAEQMLERDLASDAAALLEGRVDLSRSNHAAMIYLRSLANARRDEAFSTALAQSVPELRESASILWLTAAHAWNVGDLESSSSAVSRLLALQPNNPRARLLKIEILLRQDRSQEVVSELEKPVEELRWSGVKDRSRISALLAHFGFVERGMVYAYKTFLEHRDQKNAWMSLPGVVFQEGREKSVSHWDIQAVQENAAVDVGYEGGESGFFVVEPSADLRKLDGDALEPDHPIAKALWGKSKGEKAVLPDGRTATIKQVRHKHIARFHEVLERYQERFPADSGIRRVNFDASTPGGLDEFIETLREIADQKAQARDQYRSGPLPLGFFASRVGADVIDASLGLAAEGVSLKVAIGNADERRAAQTAIKRNNRKGCVLDLLALWTAWRLKSLDTIVAECGPIHVPQTVMDQLRDRRERLAGSRESGLRLGSHQNGKLALQEIPPEIIQEWYADVENLIDWVQQHGTISPLLMTDDLPQEFRNVRQEREFEFLDSMLVAFQKQLLLVSDDLPTRQLASGLPGLLTTWQHQIYFVADETRKLDRNIYVRWTADLVEAGHNYLTVSSAGLATALRLDFEASGALGKNFKALARMIGGKSADLESHISVVIGSFALLWRDRSLPAKVRSSSIGYLLDRLTSERPSERGQILAHVVRRSYPTAGVHAVVLKWIRGQSLIDETRSSLDEIARSSIEGASRAERRRATKKLLSSRIA